MERLEFDLVVIGTGIAGLCAAIAAAEEGRSVAVLSKETAPEECNTRYAQGGIVARGADDTPALLASDIMVAGDNVGFPEAVELLATEGPALVEELLVSRLGVPFDRGPDGRPGADPRGRPLGASHPLRAGPHGARHRDRAPRAGGR